jgi:hypothetical protein
MLIFMGRLLQEGIDRLSPLTQLDIQVVAFPFARGEILAKLHVFSSSCPIGFLGL